MLPDYALADFSSSRGFPRVDRPVPGRGGGIVDRPDLVPDRKAYLPDPAEPIDRWLQAANASNARSTKRIIQTLHTGAPITAVIDPFAGGGSTAAAARMLGLPFLGIELDPVLACASLAKILAKPEHAAALAMYSEARTTVQLAERLAILAKDHGDDEALILACLTLVQFERHINGQSPLTAADITEDLRRAPAAVAHSRMICGDSLTSAAWDQLSAGTDEAQDSHGHVVVYTSPPFGETSPRLAAPASVAQLARELLGAPEAVDDGDFPDYDESVVAVAVRVMERHRQATLIIEHEPDHVSGVDTLAQATDRLGDRLGDTLRGLDVFRSSSFSQRGPLSFIVCDLRR